MFVRGRLQYRVRLREKEIGGGGREEEVDSQCYYSMMMRSTLSRSLVTLDRQELDGSLQHGSGRQERKQGGC